MENSHRNQKIIRCSVNHVKLLFTIILIQQILLQKIFAQNDATCPTVKCNGKNTTSINDIEKCRCDSNCSIYGDCCIDSFYKSKRTNDFDCVEMPLRARAVYIKRTCSAANGWVMINRCSSSKKYDEPKSNYTLKLPVTASNGITYGNRYCAACDNVTIYTSWRIRFYCESHNTVININQSSVNFTNYVFNNTIQKWTYVEGNNTEICAFFPIASRILKNSLRKCYPKMVNSCPPRSVPREYSKKCSDFTSVVKSKNGTYFKNEYCALCNNISSTDLGCTSSTSSNSKRRTIGSSTSTMPPLVPDSSATSKSATSYSTNVTDTTSNTQVREFLHIYVKERCQDLVESISLQKLIVETKVFTTIKRTRLKEVVNINGYPIRICKEAEDESETITETFFAVKFITNSGITISLILISLYLYDFFFICSSSTTIQKNIASYAIALMIGNIGFLASNLTNNLCHLLGAVTYFGFLTSFFWLSALTFDISCKTWCCLQEFNTFDKNLTNSRKFTAFSLISWIFPPIITFIMTYVAERNNDFILEGRVYETCWFQGDQTLLLFFVFPLIITMSINSAFYLFSAYVVWVDQDAVSKLFIKHGVDFKFHSGIIIIGNLMWSTSLIAMYHENSFLWICFACFNVILGLLVYLSSPIKHTISTKIADYLNSRFLPVKEK